MKYNKGQRLLLKDGREVVITSRRNAKEYAFPIWFRDVNTGMPNGCRIGDVVRRIPKKPADNIDAFLFKIEILIRKIIYKITYNKVNA